MSLAMPAPRTAALLLVSIAALAFGAWVSFRYSFAAWGPDPDIYVTVELWRGVKRHGLSFLPSWIYTQDNWLLSLLPFMALAYELFGARPDVAIASGWVIFILSIGMTGWLGARLAGWRVGLALAAVLIFAGFKALGGAGYFSYPISHNLSQAWALLTLIMAVRALEKRGWASVAGVGLALFVNTVSDPWAAVAIAMPLLLTATAMAVAYRRLWLGRRALTLAAAAALALLAARTQAFGLLGFLPKTHFQLADLSQMKVNLYWGAKSLAAIFDILPGRAGEETAGLISLAAFAVVFCAAATLCLLRIRAAPATRQLVVGVTLLSVGATVVLYVAGRYVGTLGSGRFFANLYFLGGLLAALAVYDRWPAWGRLPRIIVCAYAGLFILAGLTSAPHLWRGGAPVRDGETAELAGVLQRHGLSYGYGVFWGTRALVMGAETQGQVIIRPVSFRGGKVHRRPAQTSSLWFAPGDEPAAGRRFMVIRSDGEECPDLAACVELARRQIGEPAERFYWRDAVILVWPGSIAARISPP